MRARQVKFEFPYSKDSFKDRYTRQSRSGPCSTIVAHLSKDGLMFIHPTQNRSVTPREAARIQSFPDWFALPGSRSHAFRLIGNAVPPLVAEAVGRHLADFLSSSKISRKPNRFAGTRQNAARTQRLAADLQAIAKLNLRELQQLSKVKFLQGWRALLLLFPDLHPDNAKEHGDSIRAERSRAVAAPNLCGISEQRFARSGWPVALVLIGREAWRRFDLGSITASDLYCRTQLNRSEREGATRRS
jgi:DNA (cytosine-5)-methyltransferase 1